MNMVPAEERKSEYLGTSLEIVTPPSRERKAQKSHGTRILLPSNDVKLPWRRCHARPIGAVQTLKTNHTKAASKSTPARRNRAIRLRRKASGELDISTSCVL